MFDIIRGRRSTPIAPQRRTINPTTSATEPPLVRAPGCPLRTTPSGLHSIKRAATMPNQTTETQHVEADRQDHTLHFRRSMTTDERVQHWRQSHQQTPPQRSTTSQKKPNSMCGAFTSDVKHIMIGDSHYNSPQARGLPQCIDCAILAQTLGRLRYNLALSKQSSSKQAHTPQDTISSPAHPLTSPHAVDAAWSSRDHVIEPTQESREMCAGSSRQNSHAQQMRTVPEAGRTEQERVRRSLAQASTLQDTRPKEPCATIFTTPEASNYQEPESYYRSHERLKDAILQRMAAKHRTPTMGAPILRSHTSMPISACMAQQQERRRPSNHTDDRDWMA